MACPAGDGARTRESGQYRPAEGRTRMPQHERYLLQIWQSRALAGWQWAAAEGRVAHQRDIDQSHRGGGAFMQRQAG